MSHILFESINEILQQILLEPLILITPPSQNFVHAMTAQQLSSAKLWPVVNIIFQVEGTFIFPRIGL